MIQPSGRPIGPPRRFPIGHGRRRAAPAPRGLLDDVRIHTDSTAARSAAAVDARAYTVGRDIVFGAGQHAPHTPEGRRLLAHELTHVLQNHDGGGGDRRSRRKGNFAGWLLCQHRKGHRGLLQCRAGLRQAGARRLLAVLRGSKTTEDDFDSDNKARAVVNQQMFKGEDISVRTLLVQEMIAGAVGDTTRTPSW